MPAPLLGKGLQAQIAPELMQQLLRYAQARAKLVRRAGRPVSDTYAQELVEDAYADVLIGDQPWDPRCALIDHLRQAIKRRTWLEIRHARRVPLVSLEAANDETTSSQMKHALARAPQAAPHLLTLSAMAATVCKQLRALVAQDADVLAVVRCWAAGATEKDEVMQLAGLTAAAYKCARERLRKSCRALSSDLRESAQDLLRTAA